MATPTLPPDQAAIQLWMEGVEVRLGLLESPQQPAPAYACAKADLPAASAFINCVVRLTDLNILAHSDGANWIREDTGAVA